MAVVREVFLILSSCFAADVAGGRERESSQVIAVDLQLFLDAVTQSPDVIQLIEPVLQRQLVVLVADFLIVDHAGLLRVLDA